jgi:O-antigen/teichoic acid export membrane protein
VAWAGAGAAAGLWVFIQQGVPGPHDVSLGWLRERWSYSSRSFVSATSTTAVTLVGSMLMALVSGPQAVGAIRAALMLERPSAALQLAVATSAATDIARERPDNSALMVIQRRTLLIATAVAVLNLLVLVLLPDSVGEAALGQMWPLVAPLVVLIGLRVVISASQSGLRAALLGRRQIKIVMYVDILSSVTTIVGLVVGAAIADAPGAMWGSLPGLALATVCWWAALRRHLRTATDLAPASAAG